MVRVFNPPPNWPTPQPGWRPPPGWQPDTAWGPPPPGWDLWAHANRHPIRDSAITGVLTFAGFMGVLQVAGWFTASRMGFLLVPAVGTTGAVAFLAHNSLSRWRWWKYTAAFAVAMGVATLLVGSRILQESGQ